MTSPADFWPLFRLRVRTPRVELRYPSDEDVADVAALAVKGIHPPDEMPFPLAWTDVPSPQQERNTMQHYWRMRASTTPAEWGLPFAVVADGVIVGVQVLHASDFAVTRAVKSGSWLGQAYQGRGIGREMRIAVLHLAFAGLGAEVAFSGAMVGNEASMRVSRRLGYEDDGFKVVSVRGRAQREIRFRLERARWEASEPGQRDDIVIEGLAPCLPLLGAGGP